MGRAEGCCSTCIFVQTLSLVMSSLDTKHLSVLSTGHPDPRSLANSQQKENRHLRPEYCSGSEVLSPGAALNLSNEGSFKGTCEVLYWFHE